MPFVDTLRRAVASGLCYSVSMGCLYAADESVVRVDKPRSSVIVRPWQATYVPPANITSTNRFASLIRGSNMYLTVQDAIALALENNIDLAIQRYSPLASYWAIQRAEAGGALRGVNTVSNSSQNVTAGLGVQGTSSIVGNTGNNFGSSGSGPSGGATISQIGPVSPNFDAVYQNTTAFLHTTTPQYATFLSGVTDLISNQRILNNSIQQGFATGGSVSLSFNNQYLNQNATTNNRTRPHRLQCRSACRTTY
jgi:outer membrane protein